MQLCFGLQPAGSTFAKHHPGAEALFAPIPQRDRNELVAVRAVVQEAAVPAQGTIPSERPGFGMAVGSAVQGVRHRLRVNRGPQQLSCQSKSRPRRCRLSEIEASPAPCVRLAVRSQVREESVLAVVAQDDLARGRNPCTVTGPPVTNANSPTRSKDPGTVPIARTPSATACPRCVCGWR